MRYYALACDYDGTLAHDGVVDAATVAALKRLRSSGRRLLMVTGREVDDLCQAFPAVSLFEWVVAENGAVLYCPETRAVRALASPPAAEFVQRLRQANVTPLSIGQVIVATLEPHENAVLAAIRSTSGPGARPATPGNARLSLADMRAPARRHEASSVARTRRDGRARRRQRDRNPSPAAISRTLRTLRSSMRAASARIHSAVGSR